MGEELIITNERADDIPLLLAQMERMEVPALLDDFFPTHGNRQGLNLSRTTTAWLAHILPLGHINNIKAPQVSLLFRERWGKAPVFLLTTRAVFARDFRRQ